MTRYRWMKRGTEVDAIQWDGQLSTAMDFIDAPFSVDDKTRVLFLPWTEGLAKGIDQELEVRLGEWIIRDPGAATDDSGAYGRRGDDYFRAFYEVVDE